MERRELNTLAAQTKNGCKQSEEIIFRKFLPVIYKMSQKIRHIIDDEVAFESECVSRIQRAICDFEPDKDSFVGIVEFRLRQSMNHFLTRRKKRMKVTSSFEGLMERSDNKEEKKFRMDFIDNLAVVDDNILTKEKIALLAKGDSRKKAILLAWSDGFYNDSALSELLAQLFGGKPESHRTAIKRFRAHCQDSLQGIARQYKPR